MLFSLHESKWKRSQQLTIFHEIHYKIHKKKKKKIYPLATANKLSRTHISIFSAFELVKYQYFLKAH